MPAGSCRRRLPIDTSVRCRRPAIDLDATGGANRSPGPDGGKGEAADLARRDALGSAFGNSPYGLTCEDEFVEWFHL